jgi:ankyrin repeat protein
LSYQDIHVAELDELLHQDDLVVIDIRDEATRAGGTLPGAQPPSDALIHRLARKRRANPPVLVYCYHGNSSRDMCGLLAQFGLSRIYNLAGGWVAWESWQQATPTFDEFTRNWLLSHGFDRADLNSRVDLGMTPLMLAALQGKHELVQVLLGAGADPRAVNDDEHHALWFACVHGDIDLVKRLIEAGSDLNNRNVNGVTCAIYAASTGKLDVLQALVEAGADLTITTHDDVSVLESAATLPVLRYLRPLLRKAG